MFGFLADTKGMGSRWWKVACNKLYKYLIIFYILAYIAYSIEISILSNYSEDYELLIFFIPFHALGIWIFLRLFKCLCKWFRVMEIRQDVPRNSQFRIRIMSALLACYISLPILLIFVILIGFFLK